MENNNSDRTIAIERTFNAPIELVWEMWTNPDHIKNWWGPNGFSNTIYTMDMKVGGEWDLVMHGPDGTDYKNKSVFREIIHHRRIVYDHISGPKFTATVDFESRGNTTHIRWEMLFLSKKQLIEVVKEYNAAEGLKQNAERLDTYMQATIQQKQ